MTVLNELKYNNDINQKRAYAASDTADEKVCSPPRANVHKCCVHLVIIVAILNECAVLKNPIFHERYGWEHIKHDDYGTQESSL